MRWTNYHSHCRYCDGSDQPERYVEQALTEGLLAYGFSSHAPLPFDCEWCLKTDELRAYFQEIVNLQYRWREDIQLYCGLEVDYIPGVIGPKSAFLRQLPFDYFIGSVHFVDSFPDGPRWEIDGSHPVFLRGLAQIFGGDAQAAVTRYFALTRQMVREEPPDVVGHLDKIKIQNEEGRLFSETDDWYRAEMTETLDVIAEAGVMVEVNTRGLYRKKATDTYPSRWVLEQMHRMNIPVVISSDAHRPAEITSHFAETARTLKEIGYSRVRVLLNGKWRSVAFDDAGVLGM
ncbi:MAG: histidinol-phosphatase [Ferruginibacter sp.]|nr:histidinol-phosphatase [Cytophagales bacterium]